MRQDAAQDSYRDLVRVIVKSIRARISFVIEGCGKHGACVRYVLVGSLCDPGMIFLSLRICSTRGSLAVHDFLTALQIAQLSKRSMRAGFLELHRARIHGGSMDMLSSDHAK